MVMLFWEMFITGRSLAYLVLLYVYVQISRIIVVGVSFPFLRYFGYGLDWKEAVIIIWSGLRGAVALSLSLSFKRTSDSSTLLSSDTGVRFVFFTGGIFILTVIVNGSTTQFLLRVLAMDRISAAKRRMLHYTKYEMLHKALEAFKDLGDDEELGPTDWPSVRKHITSLHDVDCEPVHPHTAGRSDNNLDFTNLKAMRESLLNGVQAAYWTMLDEGRITQSTAYILMQSVDEAFDLVSTVPLCDWKSLKSRVHFPNYYKYLQTSIFPQKLVMYITVERLESACLICAAFLRAHKKARQELHGLIGDSDIASIIINESEEQGEEAKKFLEDVRITFPQVLCVVKTRQVSYSVLNHLNEYLQNLEKVGLLEEKDMLHLHDAVETDLKKLLWSPQLVKDPKIGDLISLSPLMGALPSSVRESLEASTKETMKLRGLSLYKEGASPTGIWLISTGVVRWTSMSLKNRHSLHRTFSHGSTLGLYEVLAGKPYICDIITDSAVLCFFIETDKILSVLRSDPSVEDFLWQESAIMLLKLLLPQKFEKMAMQYLRALVAERSTMTVHIGEEFINIPHHSIGILLEGFLRIQGGQDELIASPALLLSSYGYQSFPNMEPLGTIRSQTSLSQGSRYLADSRSRVILFDLAAFESDSALNRGTSSFFSHAVDSYLRSLGREHTGLMSWPIPEGTNQQANSLSTKAMLLSIYGSMVNVRPRTRSFPRSVSTELSHTVSFINAPVSDSRPLVTVRSETDSTGQSSTDPKQSNVVIDDDSSDISGGEEDICNS